MQRWAPGTPITWRYGDDPAEPMTVVRDDDTGLVAWDGHDVLRIAPTNSWWSVWVLFDAATHAFEGWRVHLEDPHTRGADEVRTRDHVLGLRVEPDRTCLRTHEHELQLAVQQGRYNRDEAELITTVAEQAEKVVAEWGSPFCDGWEDFTPDPS